MTLSLKDRVCIITGAGQGIGEGIARGFARRGAIVIATSLEAPTIDEAAMNLQWDVADPQQAKAIMQQVVDRFGRVDALVTNAGIYPRQPWDEISAEDWHRVMSVNIDGTWHPIQAAAHHMTKQGYGKIVTVTSVEVRMGVPVHAHYDTTKAGVIGMTRSMARALGPRGVRVNALMPGAILTPTELIQFPDQEASTKRVNERQCIPDRLLPEDIEPAFAFLCAAESDAITGQVLCVDKGLIHY